MSGALALVLSGCDVAGPGAVYDRDLGAAIEQLKADVAAAPTDESTVTIETDAAAARFETDVYAAMAWSSPVWVGGHPSQ